MAAPGKFDLHIYRGDTFSAVVTWARGTPVAPVDLTGATIAAQVRAGTESTTVVATLTATITNAAAGEITLSLTPVQTAATATGAFVWDLQVTQAGAVTTILAGRVIVTADVTRP